MNVKCFIYLFFHLFYSVSLIQKAVNSNSFKDECQVFYLLVFHSFFSSNPIQKAVNYILFKDECQSFSFLFFLLFFSSHNFLLFRQLEYTYFYRFIQISKSSPPLGSFYRFLNLKTSFLGGFFFSIYFVFYLIIFLI